MDTVISMKSYGENSEAALDAAVKELYRLEKCFSATDPNSELCILNQTHECSLSDDLLVLLQKAVQLSAAVDGAFDCSVAPVMDAWGWYRDDPAIPEPAILQEALSHVNYSDIIFEDTAVRLQDGMSLDLGGIAKGYTAGRIAEIMLQQGVSSALIDLGGNIRVVGSKPDGSAWTIGIHDPSGNALYLATVSVSDLAVVTSGTSQRYFEEDGQLWHHILDPETGWPVDNDLAQVTVICSDDTLADGLSTTLFVMGLEKASEFWRSGTFSFDAVFITKDGTVHVTDGIRESFRCDADYEVIEH